MGKSTKTQTLLYHDKPLFGLDIGHGSLKVMQISPESTSSKAMPRLQGYGWANFDEAAIDDGVIVKPEIIAAALKQLFDSHLIGDIATRRVALTIPAYRTFTRAISLPKMPAKDMASAVESEAANYVPVPLADLYLDWEVIKSDADGQDLLAVAVPKNIVDSYTELCRLVDLEPILIETTMHAAAKLMTRDSNGDVPAMIIDFGSQSSDISLSEQQKILVLGTVAGGGESFSHAIEHALGVSFEAAGVIKNKYGLGVSKKQREITAALTPTLAPIIKEIRRMLRYYEDRFSGHEPIGQIVILGGGANMPGLGDYLTSELRLPARTCDPWQYFNANHLQLPATADKSMFSTAAGLSLIKPGEVFA